MIASIWCDYFENLSPENAVLAIRDAGFCCGDFGLDHSQALLARSADVEKTGLEFHRFMADIGFSTPQGHLDFLKDLTLPETVETLKKEITLFQAIGVKNAVIHIGGGSELPEDVRKEKQLNSIRQLLEFVRGTDFTICLENLRPNPSVADADRILEWIHALGCNNLGICLDTGHLHVARVSLKTTEQTQREFILKAGSYLKAVHINGNDGTDDYHLAPYSIKNSLDWKEVLRALHQIGYKGLFNLEVPGEIKGNPPMYVLKHKLRYLKGLADYMLSDDFLNEQEMYL